MHYQITSSQGVDLGIHEGDSARDALDALARAGGAESHDAACAITGSRRDDWTTDRFAFKRGGIGMLVVEEPPVTLAALVARSSAEGWDVGRYMAELEAAGLSRKLYVGARGQWIGEGEDGYLYAFPGEENGWARRRQWTGAAPREATNPRNALGTGWVGGPAPSLDQPS